MTETFEFRVTSVWQSSKKWVCFSGVPLVKNGYKTKSVKDIFVINTKPDLLPMSPTIGQHWRVTGKSDSRIVAHGEHSITEHHIVSPSRCEVTLPHDGEQFIRFVSKEADFKGIGDAKARELWSMFKADIFNILNQKDVTSLTKVLTEQAANSLIKGFKKYANLKYSTWFADRKIPPHIQQKFFKYHQENSVQAITENPYRLITFGMSFTNADQIAQTSFNVEIDDHRRFVGAVEHVLKKHSSQGGHTCATHQDISTQLIQLLKSKNLAALALKTANLHKSYFIDKKTGCYHHTPLLIMEKVVARRLLSLNQKVTEDSFELDSAYSEAFKELPYDLSEKQTEAVFGSLTSHVYCITGGAGTGKTTVLRTVLRAYNSLDFNISAIALSGRAAMRLHQSIGFKTSTIAAFLRDDAIDNDGKNIVVIDEASMLDLATMYKIVAHINPSVRLLFVGDYHQLPPIGAGLILADIVKSKVIGTTELDIVQRQDAKTGIPSYSHQIKMGKIPTNLNVGNIHFHEVELAEVANQCVELYRKSPDKSQIVAATKKMTSEINQQCQLSINSDAERLVFDEFGQRYSTDLLLNDPVLFTKNNYDAGVQNGTIGKLISVENTDKHLAIVRLDDNNEEILITRMLLDSLDAAYCITLHKAQGSQFKRVIVALSKTSMIDRAWLYTAVTRSEDELHIVGTKERLEQAIHSLSAHHIRQTHLRTLLSG